MTDEYQAAAARVDRANREHRRNAGIGLVLCAIAIVSQLALIVWVVWAVSRCLR